MTTESVQSKPSSEPQRSLRIFSEPQSRKRELISILDRFHDLLQAESTRGILGTDWFHQIQEEEKWVRQRFDQPFSLVVIGDFKRGKSTLINALLGSPVVTTDVTPETVTINLLRYGPEHRLRLVLEDGRQVELKPDDLHAIQLKKTLDRLPNPPAYLSIEYPADWLKGMQLVDTPGMSDLFARFDRQVKEFLPQADAVIYVISALSPLSETERSFLRLSLAPQDFSKVCFVINQLDQFETLEDARRVVDSIRDKLTPAFHNSPVFGASALDEYSRVCGQGRPNPEMADDLAAAFDELRSYLNESILLNRDLVQTDRGVVQASQMVAGFSQRLRQLEAAVGVDQARLDQAIEQCQNQNSALFQSIASRKQEVRTHIEGMGEETIRWMMEFLDRFNRESVAHLEEYPYEDVKRHFPFFLADSLHDALLKCLETHQSQILDELSADEETLGSLSSAPFLLSSGSQINGAISVAGYKDRPWTMIDNCNMVLNHLQISPLITMTIQSVLALFNKSAQGPKLVQAYSRQLTTALPELRSQIETEIRRTYGELASRLEQALDAGYKKEVEQSLAMLEQAQELRNQGQDQTQAALGKIERLTAEAGQLQNQLDQLREKMQAEEQVVEVA